MKEINVMYISENRNISSPNSFGGRKNHPRSSIVISSLALFLYIFVIVLTLRNKKLRRRPANKFLLNLFISDGIVCISFISFDGHLLAIWDDKRSFLDYYLMLPTPVIFAYVTVVLSMLNFTLITADRLIAVKWPFFYMERIHTKQSLIAIAVVWGITIAYAILMITIVSVLDLGTTRYLGNVSFLVVVTTGFITLFISNSFVFVEARGKLRAFEKIAHGTGNIAESNDKSKNREKESRKKEFKLVRIIIGLILCFFLFWINALILTIRKMIHINEVDPPISYNYYLVTWYLIQLYYIFNPLWYVALSYDVKREVKQLFGRKQGRKNNFFALTVF